MFADISLGMYNAYRGENYLTSLVKMVNDGKSLEDYAKTALSCRQTRTSMRGWFPASLPRAGTWKHSKPVVKEEEEESEQPEEKQLTFANMSRTSTTGRAQKGGLTRFRTTS